MSKSRSTARKKAAPQSAARAADLARLHALRAERRLRQTIIREANAVARLVRYSRERVFNAAAVLGKNGYFDVVSPGSNERLTAAVDRLEADNARLREELDALHRHGTEANV